MQYIRANNTIALRLDKGDEIVACIKQVAEQEHISLGFVSGIGGTDLAHIGVFDTARRDYDRYTITGTHEICSLSGDINTMDGEVYPHLHIALAGEGGALCGGHLFSCVISLTAEISITLLDACVDRSHNASLGINTWDFDKVRNG